MKHVVLGLLLALLAYGCADHQAMVEKSRIHYDMAFDLLQKGEQAQAISQVNEAIRLNPKDPTYRNLLGLIYMNRSMLDAAEKEFLEALRLKADYADVNNNLCGLYITQGLWDKAIEQCKIAISHITYSSPERAYLNMGWAYYKKTDFMQAIESYNKALLHRQDFYLAYQNRGVAYFDIAKYNLAINDFKKAANGCTFCPEPYYRLGLALFKVDQKNSAMKSFKKCAELDKEGEIGQQCQNFLRKTKPAR